MNFFKSLSTLFLVCLVLPAFSQTRFEKGYIISQDGRRLSCQIRNGDWENNPATFKYRLSEKETVGDGDLSGISEFGFDNGVSYVRATVKVDQSSINLSTLSSDRNPDWSERTVFLKKLVSGPANLFFYKDGHIRQYFYQKRDSTVVTLINKQYRNSEGDVVNNNAYRQQLWNEVNCGSVSRDEISRINYLDGDIERYFNKYNKCMEPTRTVAKNKRNAFNIRLTPGLDFTMLQSKGYTQVDTENGKGNNLSFRVGAELEYVAPFNNGKWSVLVEPSFQYYKFSLVVTSLPVQVDYWSIDLPMGLRHGFFFSNGGKAFVDALYVPDLKNKALNSSSGNMEVTMNPTFAFGAGVAKGRLSGELRYYLSRNIASSYIKIDQSFSKISLILAYRIFSR